VLLILLVISALREAAAMKRWPVAQEVVERYPRGSAVQVHFNPKRPGESVLEPRLPASGIVVLAMAIALLALAMHIYHFPT